MPASGQDTADLHKVQRSATGADPSINMQNVHPTVRPTLSTASTDLSSGSLSASRPLKSEELLPFVVQGISDELAREEESITKVEGDFDRSPKVEAELHQRKRSVSMPVHTRIAKAGKKPLEWPAKKDLLGVEVSATDYESLARTLVTAARRGEAAVATFLPVHGIVTAALEPGYRYRVNAFQVVAPDGQPVRWALNILHKAKLPDRVCGPQMMARLCAKAAEEGIGIYLYGSTTETLAQLKIKLEDQFPALRIVGVESPPFRDLTEEENQAACDRINASKAGFVFIGLGCPRQDLWAYQNRNRINSIQLCVGAAFDFHAGNKKLAPKWMQSSGTEWIFRLLQEPGRLWKRYLVTNTAFVLLMTRRLISGR